MNISAILEVAIGLALIYYALGLIANIIIGTVKNILDMRAEALEAVLKYALEPVVEDLKNSEIWKNLIPINPKSFQVKNRTDRKPSEVSSGSFSLALLETLSSGDYVFTGLKTLIGQYAKQLGDDEVEQILKDILDKTDKQEILTLLRRALAKLEEKPDDADKHKSAKEKIAMWIDVLLGEPNAQLQAIEAGISTLPDGKTKATLLRLLSLSQSDLDKFKSNVEKWYNDMMQNVSLLFTQKVQIVVICVSIAVAGLLGVDSILLTKTLWEQPTKRAAVVDAVPTFIDAYNLDELTPEEIEGLTAEEKIAVIEARIQDVNLIVEGIERLDLPATWWLAPTPQKSEWAVRVLGILITGAATSFGSSFWYDILKKVTQTNPARSSKQGEG